ncbi:MAG: potassium channel protein [Dehalococcoidia bacterium]|nr:potassium channel protein [Dehalococcoidia bacterium]
MRRRLVFSISFLLAVLIVGTIGYRLIQGWSVFDSLYMTVITVTTVGYGEVHPLSQTGRIFSMFVILMGVGSAFYALTTMVQFAVEGELRELFGRRQMKDRIGKLKDHIILCGYGRVGSEVAEVLSHEGASFVVIESNPTTSAQAERDGRLVITGDATGDDVLKEAGMQRARALIAAMGTSVENTYVTLSARSIHPKLYIVARADSKHSEQKLKQAGANRVISTSSIGALRLAQLSLRPLVIEFLDTVVAGGVEYSMEEVIVDPKSALVGMTVEQSRSSCGGSNILALKKVNGELIPNPLSSVIIQAGDQLVVIGTKKQLDVVEGRAACEL